MSSASSTGERARVAQELGARLAADVLHDDEVAAGRVVEAEVEDLHDVRVHEPRGGERLAAEARDELRVVGEVLGEQLDRDLALEPAVEGELDGRHAAEAEALAELVAAGDDDAGAHGVALLRRDPPVPSWPPSGGTGPVVGRRRRCRAGVVSVGVVSGGVGLGRRRLGRRGLRRLRLGGRGLRPVVVVVGRSPRASGPRSRGAIWRLELRDALLEATGEPVVDGARQATRQPGARGRRACVARVALAGVDASRAASSSPQDAARASAAGISPRAVVAAGDRHDAPAPSSSARRRGRTAAHAH